MLYYRCIARERVRFRHYDAAFVQAMYEDYLRDPASVGQEWRELFETEAGELRLSQESGVSDAEPGRASAVQPPPTPAPANPGSPAPSPTSYTGPALVSIANMTESLTEPPELRSATPATTLDARRKAAQCQLAASFGGQERSGSPPHRVRDRAGRQALPVMTHHFQKSRQPHRVDPGAIGLGLAWTSKKKTAAGTGRPRDQARRNVDSSPSIRLRSVVEKARTNHLMPDDFAGGTMQLTNPGTSARRLGAALMKGQGSIIATGTIRDIAGTKSSPSPARTTIGSFGARSRGCSFARSDSLLQAKNVL